MFQNSWSPSFHNVGSSESVPFWGHSSVSPESALAAFLEMCDAGTDPRLILNISPPHVTPPPVIPLPVEPPPVAPPHPAFQAIPNNPHVDHPRLYNFSRMLEFSPTRSAHRLIDTYPPGSYKDEYLHIDTQAGKIMIIQKPVNNGSQTTLPNGIVTYYNPRHVSAHRLPSGTDLRLYRQDELTGKYVCGYISPTPQEGQEDSVEECSEATSNSYQWLRHFINTHVREELDALDIGLLSIHDTVALKCPKATRRRKCTIKPCDWMTNIGDRYDSLWRRHYSQVHGHEEVKEVYEKTADPPFIQKRVDTEPEQTEAGPVTRTHAKTHRRYQTARVLPAKDDGLDPNPP